MQLQNFYAWDSNGNIMPLATGMLYLPGTETLATGLQDVNGAPLSNPFTADSKGLFSIAAPNGYYDFFVNNGPRSGRLRVMFIDVDKVAADAATASTAAGVATARTVRFVSASTTAPTVRDDGSALQIGDRYVNTTTQVEYIYKSGGWASNESLAQIDDLHNQSDSTKGAAQLGWDGGNVGAQLKLSKRLGNYADLRAYSGIATIVELTQSGISGGFKSLGVVGGYTDDGGMTIIGATGIVWRRINDSVIDVVKFGAISGQNCDAAFAAAANYALAKQNGTHKTPPVIVPGGNWYLTTATPVALWHLDAGAEMFDLPGVAPSYQSDTSYLTGTVMRYSGVDQYVTLYIGDPTYTNQKKTGRVMAAQIMGASNRAAVGVSGFTFSSGRDGADQSSIGIAGQCYNDNVNTPKTGWGGYFEGIRALAGTGNAFGVESSAFNYAASILSNPYQQPSETTGVTYAYWASALGDYDSTAAMGIITAGKKFNRGIVFYNNALTSNEAVVMPFGYKMGWHLSSTSGMVSYCQSDILQQYAVDGPCYTRGSRGGATTVNNSLLKFDSWSGNNAGADAVLASARIYQTSAFSGGFATSRIDWSAKTSAGADNFLSLDSTAVFPLTTSGLSSGKASNLWSQVFAATSTISTSDERYKTDIKDLSDQILDAWEKVQFQMFRMKDAKSAKGKEARWHFGVIAQRVKAAFEDAGLDPFAYGLLCYDEWDEQEAVDSENIEERVPAVKAGNRYGIRYEEALVLECALARRSTIRLEERIASLEGK